MLMVSGIVCNNIRQDSFTENYNHIHIFITTTFLLKHDNLLYGKLRTRSTTAEIIDIIGSTNLATCESVNNTIIEQIITKIQPVIKITLKHRLIHMLAYSTRSAKVYHLLSKRTI